jgi:hypothetical protein
VKQFKAYIGRDSGQVICINDAFGASIAVFNGYFRPGDIAKRNVEHHKGNVVVTGQVEARFRIVREVRESEVEKLLVLAKCNLPAREGWWYEVIGD